MQFTFTFRKLIFVVFVLSISIVNAGTPAIQEEQSPSQPEIGMVLVPAGSFIMGCTAGDALCYEYEKPSHSVSVRAFFLDLTEVTAQAYQECVDGGACIAPDASLYCYYGRPKLKSHPINCVSWDQAKSYCEWLGKRLPREAEWEYAARGGHSDWKFPWGNQRADCSHAIMNSDIGWGCGLNSAWPVKSKSPYGFGLWNMAGNVSEWVEDCWHEDYKGAPIEGKPWLSEGCNTRVFRGGAWTSSSRELRASVRGCHFAFTTPTAV